MTVAVEQPAGRLGVAGFPERVTHRPNEITSTGDLAAKTPNGVAASR
jgi:hypothetical protein